MPIRPFGALVGIAVLATGVLAAEARGQETTVAVTAIVEHPALDATRDGIRDELEANGLIEGDSLEFIYQSAQGNPATAVQIARQFVGEQPDIIVPISTPSAQAVVAATQEIPIVFTAVTDPLGAQLITDLQAPGGNVTGLSDMSPLAEHLDLIKEITPETAILGVLYNPGEANSVTVVAAMSEMAAEWNIDIVEAPAPRSTDVLGAAQNLVGKVDAMYIPTDNTIVSALEAVLGVGRDNRIPVFTADTDSVVRGSIAAVGFNYYDVGRQTGALVLRILEGADPGTIPVGTAVGTDLFVNPVAAEAMGVAIPQAVIDRANTVVE